MIYRNLTYNVNFNKYDHFYDAKKITASYLCYLEILYNSPTGYKIWKKSKSR